MEVVRELARGRGSTSWVTYRAAAEVDEAAYRGVFPDYLARARVRMDIAQAIVRAREAIGELISATARQALLGSTSGVTPLV